LKAVKTKNAGIVG